MTPAFRFSVLGVLVAIAITTAMDAGGLSAFSSLPLLPLVALFWYLGRFSRIEVGFAWGRWRHHGLAVVHPLVVLGSAALIAAAAGAVHLANTDWKKAGLNLVLVTVSTILAAIVTEEGFFRGWLWASLRRAGQNEGQTLFWSSIAFSLWHWSAITLKTGFDVPAAQIPVFMINAAVLGAIWGMLRSISDSVVVASVSHGLWNGGAYVLFGYGNKVGALGVTQTSIFGPEVGFIGLLLNLALAFAFWRWWKAHTTMAG
ncbi:MAG: hypothetical protein A2Y78_03000 [Acidobacteria bacterium RBG_13_68_16]|nr:MAG: hypothetical protein A2Y78_03000 [Acidobacteria bacterium RBG_13_68_16]